MFSQKHFVVLDTFRVSNSSSLYLPWHNEFHENRESWKLQKIIRWTCNNKFEDIIFGPLSDFFLCWLLAKTLLITREQKLVIFLFCFFPCFLATPQPTLGHYQADSLIHPGPNLDLFCIRQSNAAPFCENYAKLYFDAKHLNKRLNKGWWKFWGPSFKKVPVFQKRVLFD